MNLTEKTFTMVITIGRDLGAMRKVLLNLVSFAAILSMLVPASVLASTDFKVFVIGSGDFRIHELALRATEGDNGQIIPVSDFAVKPESVVQLEQNQNLVVYTSTNEAQRVVNVKVTDASGQIRELADVGSDWSLQGFAPGVYTLDVIADIPDGSRGAFETMLIILAPNEKEKDTSQIIKQIVKIDTQTVFKGGKNKGNDKLEELRRICALIPSDPRCDPDKNGNCPPGFATNEDGQCFPTGKCPSGYHRANDDETGRCVPDRDLKQCEDGSWAYKDDTCPEDDLPICDGTLQDCVTPGGTVCEAGSTEDSCEITEPEPEVPAVLPNCNDVEAGTTCDGTEDEDSTLDEEEEVEEEESSDDEEPEEEEEEESNSDNGDEEAAAGAEEEQ